MTNETAVLDEVLGVTSLMDLQGSEGKEAKRVYLMYARKVHPDMFQNDEDKLKADKAFAHLGALRDGKVIPAKPKTNSASGSTIKTKKHEYTIGPQMPSSGIFAKYKGSFDAGHEEVFISVLKTPQDADLSETHVDAIRKLADVPKEFRLFYPFLVEGIRYRDEATQKEHAITVTRAVRGFRPMSDILAVYPDGIGGRDVAWMFRRMLVAVGNAHDLGIVNGAPTLDAFLINAEEHGIILTDWQHSVPVGEPLKAVPGEYQKVYPEGALKKEPVDGRLDIHIIATMAEQLLAPNDGYPLRNFFKGCKLETTPNASQLLAEFDELLNRVYGKRRFNLFRLDK